MAVLESHLPEHTKISYHLEADYIGKTFQESVAHVYLLACS